jgi:uncharacterized protein HemY
MRPKALNTCIMSDPTNAALWYDYGVLCVRNGERLKAEECLRESLQVLTLLAALLVQKYKY